MVAETAWPVVASCQPTQPWALLIEHAHQVGVEVRLQRLLGELGGPSELAGDRSAEIDGLGADGELGIDARGDRRGLHEQRLVGADLPAAGAISDDEAGGIGIRGLVVGDFGQGARQQGAVGRAEAARQVVAGAGLNSRNRSA
jgi:hypothetical protein